MAATIGAAAMIGCCLYVMFGRVAYPRELEWMTGSVLDHVERMRDGKPIYTAPTATWIPFLYPPLYYWIAAKAMTFSAASSGTSSVTFTVCRVVSILSTFVSAGCVWRLSRRQGATTYWAVLAVGSFFSSYSQSDYWYDLERPDSLFVAMLMVGTIVLCESRGVVGALAAGAILSTAFFAKQPAVLFIAAGAAALAWQREWHRLGAYVAVAVVILVFGIYSLNAASDGWFGYYVLKMPGKHGMSIELVPLLMLVDLPHSWLLVAATTFIFVKYLRRRGVDRADTVFVFMLVASVLASASSRLHVGGWANVLMFWTTYAACALGIVGTRLETYFRAISGNIFAEASAILLPTAVIAQYAILAYVPAEHIPTRKSVRFLDGVSTVVHELETKGDVLALSHGHLTTRRHPHIAALIDVITVEGTIPEDLLRAVREQEFVAIVVDGMADLWIPVQPQLKGSFFDLVYSRYYVARQLDGRLRPPITGWPSGLGWVLLPRKEVLPESQELLTRHSNVDLGVASWREQAERDAGAPPAHPYVAEEETKSIYGQVYGDHVDAKTSGPP